MYQALVQSNLLYGAETWTLNTQQANKLLATEMDFWRRSARKSRKGKVRNVTIREVKEVGKNILEVTEEKPKERWIDGVRQSMTNHGLTEEDTRDRDRWRNLVLGEGKPLWSGQTLDDDQKTGINFIVYFTTPFQ
jgi:hypothetical protein